MGDVRGGTAGGGGIAGGTTGGGGAAARRLILLDGLAAAGFALLPGIAVLHPAGEPGWVWPLSAAAAIPLAMRRVWPVPVFAVVAAMSCAAAVGGFGSASFLAAGYALYPVAVARPPRRWYSAAVVGGTGIAAAVALTMVGTTFPGGRRAGQIVLGLVVLAAGWAAGRAASERRERARLATEGAVRRAQAEERLRIARDMHDVVTHGMGLIAVQAGVANHVAGQRPQEAARALTAIESISRRSLRELRAMLGVLRGETWAAGEAGAPGEAGRLRPSPGLADLPELVGAARAAGVPVALVVSGLDGVPDGVALCAYRIVQEALTNVVRHAAPTVCRVRLAAGPGRLSIDVEDEGRVEPLPVNAGRPHREGGGLGLLGMRERAAAHDGTLLAGPRPGHGFTVSTVLYY